MTPEIQPLTVYLDFDGTIVEHEYPKMGRCNFGCFEVIKALQDAGHKIILNTYRADCNDGTLERALKFINEQYYYCTAAYQDDLDFEMQPITEWLPNKRHPLFWDLQEAIKTGKLYIDDICSGIPLKSAVMTKGDMVDWKTVDEQLEAAGIYKTSPVER